MDTQTKEVFAKSFSTVIVQIIGVAARLVTSIVLGRILGVAGLGDVNLINQIITILMVISMFGMDHVLVKKISIGHFNRDYQSIGVAIYTSLRVNLIIAVLLTILSVIGASFISEFFSATQLKFPLIVAAIALVPQTISIVFASVVNGFNKVWQGRLLKDFLTSLFVLMGVFFAWYLKISIDLFSVIAIYTISRFLTFIIAFLYVKNIYNPIFFKGVVDKTMIKMAKPLLFVSATTLLSSSLDVIMLGWLSNSSSVGLYTVATRLVLFIAFFLQITNAVLSPKIAAYFANNELSKLTVMIKQVTFVLIIIGVLSTIFFVILGKPILSVWGHDFTEAYYCLVILCFGQFINISTGCSGVLLIMSGNEKVFSYITSISLLFNFTLNLVLISKYDILGAAIATSITIAGENIVKVIIAKKKTGILTIPIGLKN